MLHGPAPTPADAPLIPNSEALAALIEIEGLDKALDLLGLPPDIKRDFKAMRRRLGQKAVIEALCSFVDMLEDVIPPDPPPPVPRPPRRKPAAPKSGKPASRPAEDRSQDDEIPDQLDLF